MQAERLMQLRTFAVSSQAPCAPLSLILPGSSLSSAADCAFEVRMSLTAPRRHGNLQTRGDLIFELPLSGTVCECGDELCGWWLVGSREVIGQSKGQREAARWRMCLGRTVGNMQRVACKSEMVCIWMY
mmetsp:Transcript_4932/g.14985  ORF Transcript_4932/g.14985 Transcript_4932/m.14985 type:complete len:129 (-) Transcript_4932:65-451(-)